MTKIDRDATKRGGENRKHGDSKLRLVSETESKSG